MLNKKRGQVTSFVIIGLAILLIAGIFLLPGPVREPSTLVAQQDAARVTAIIQSCLAQAGQDAVRDIGGRGGYADEGLTGLRATPDQRTTQVVTMPVQSVPLWHEVHPCTDNAAGCVGNNRPRLCTSDNGCPVRSAGASEHAQSIQEAIELVTASRVGQCVAQARLDGPTLQAIGEPTVVATIREDEILLALTYPLEMTASDGDVVDLNDFRTSLDVALPRAYRLAAGIQDAEREQAYLEESFLHLLAIYSGVDTPLPPVRDVRLFGSQKYWARTEVQQVIQDDLLPFLGFTQVLNAQESFTPILPDNLDDPYAAYQIGAYQYLTVKLDTNDTYPLGARFEYPGTPIYLDLGGKELIKPDTLSGGGIFAKMAGLFFTQYRVKYTTAFPLVVRVTDATAFNGEGFELAFGLEGNIKSNYPLNTSRGTVRLVAPDVSADIADPVNLVRHTYRVHAIDHVTGSPLAEATVTFLCGPRIQMGITDANGAWSGQLPYCLAGGILLVEKHGYLANGEELVNTVDDNAASDVELSVWPLIEKRVLLFKRSPTDIAAISASGGSTDALTTVRTPLGTQDQALVTIAREKSASFEDDVPLAGALSFGATGGSTQSALADALTQLETALTRGDITQAEYDDIAESLSGVGSGTPQVTVSEVTAAFAPGTYDAEILLLYRGRIEIPAEERCESSILGDKCYTLPAQNLTGWTSGGAILTGSDSFELTAEFLASDRPLVLYALEQPLPRVWQDLERHQDLATYQTYDRVAMVRPQT